MHISFAPQRRDDALVVLMTDDVLTVNAEAFDFTSLPDGASIPAGEVPCEFVVGPVERIHGVIHLTLILPHGSNPSHAVAFPQPLMITADGPINLPTDEADHVDA